MDSSQDRSTTRTRTAAWLLAGVLLFVLVTVACVALSGWMDRAVQLMYGHNQAGDLGTVGQYFDASSAVFSGLAFVLLIGTTALQRRELTLQRKELTMQREELSKSHRELHRSAEADLRSLHMQLIKMAIDDPALAEVWGEYRENVSAERNRQYLYANLIFSHLFLNHQLNVIGEPEIMGYLRIVARSAIFREYWEAGAESRGRLAESSAEHEFGSLVDQAMTEPPEPPDGLRVA